MAYQSSPTLQYQRSQQRITDETYVQARAGYRPQVTVNATGQRDDFQRQTANTAQAYVTATQPIYTGGRTAAAVGAAEADILSGRETLRRAEAQVLQSVVQAYADVLRDQQAVAIRELSVTDLQGQMREIDARAKAGDLTRTDVAQSQGFLFQAQMELAAAKGQLEISNASYEAAVGQAPGKLDPLPPLPNMPASLDQAFATAEEGNPALRANMYDEQAARLRTAEARDQRLPNVSVQVQYGARGPLSIFTPNLYGQDVSIAATVTQPLFSGGAINSQIRQQIEREQSARLTTEQTRRTMVQQISQSWASFLANKEGAREAAQAVDANQTAWEGVQKERRADLRSTLEALYIEQSLRQSQLSLAASQHDAYVAASNLLYAVGLLEAARIVPGINVYDPANSFNRVRMQGAVPWEVVPAALDHLTVPPLHREPLPPIAEVGPSAH